jgi:hypothetical protein
MFDKVANVGCRCAKVPLLGIKNDHLDGARDATVGTCGQRLLLCLLLYLLLELGKQVPDLELTERMKEGEKGRHFRSIVGSERAPTDQAYIEKHFNFCTFIQNDQTDSFG